MEPSKLRKGNYVYSFINSNDKLLYTTARIRCLHLNSVELISSGIENCPIEEVPTYFDKCYTTQYSQILPILLNTEWLNKLGFRIYSDCFYYVEYRGQKIDGWFLNSNNELTKSLSEFYVRAGSVHELQNLWHSLTGQELVAIREPITLK